MNTIKIKNKINSEIDNYYKVKNSNQKLSNTKITLSEPIFDNLEAKHVINCFLNGNLSQGKLVKDFENKFSKEMNCKYGIATNSGSSANLIALDALKQIYKIKNGSEVIIPASTFATVAMPIIQLGLKPVYVDIDIETLNLNIDQLKKAININTKIIMPVHTLGMPANMIEITKIAKNNKLLVFEDCCEAHGAAINQKKVGSFGKISAFSFFVAHNMTTIEGGMILTNDKAINDKCRSLREFGRIPQKLINKDSRYYSDKFLKDYDKRYVFTEVGYNMRMTEVHAGLGLIQLKKLNRFNSIRIKNASFLSNLINKNLADFFLTTKKEKNYTNTYYTFPLILKKNIKKSRRQICEFLENNRIQTRPMMGGCLPDQPAFRGQPGRIVGSLKNSRYIRDNCFFIGIHPMVTKKALINFVKLLKTFLR